VRRLSRLVGIFLSVVWLAAASGGPLRAHDYRAGQGDHQLSEGAEAQHYLRIFRESGDDQALDEAWRLLEPRLGEPGVDSDTLVLAATVAQSRHEFDQARSLLDRVLSAQPSHQQALLLLASLQVLQGDTHAAAGSCRRLQRVSALVQLVCRARVALADDNYDREFRALSAALPTLTPTKEGREVYAWAVAVAGDLATAALQNQNAIGYYEQSLALVESTQVRAALVDRLLAQGRLVAAEAALDVEATALALKVRRMIVARRQGRESSVSTAIALADAEFQRWIAARDWAHAREMARFYLDVLERHALAFRLASINLESQREPEDILLFERAAKVAGEQPILPPVRAVSGSGFPGGCVTLTHCHYQDDAAPHYQKVQLGYSF
jgi:tetratricopeptide (TPR) repeat protein